MATFYIHMNHSQAFEFLHIRVKMSLCFGLVWIGLALGFEFVVFIVLAAVWPW